MRPHRPGDRRPAASRPSDSRPAASRPSDSRRPDSRPSSSRPPASWGSRNLGAIYGLKPGKSWRNRQGAGGSRPGAKPLQGRVEATSERRRCGRFPLVWPRPAPHCAPAAHRNLKPFIIFVSRSICTCLLNRVTCINSRYVYGQSAHKNGLGVRSQAMARCPAFRARGGTRWRARHSASQAMARCPAFRARGDTRWRARHSASQAMARCPVFRAPARTVGRVSRFAPALTRESAGRRRLRGGRLRNRWT